MSADGQVDPTRVVPNQSNATVLMLQSAQSPITQFDVVDIDPYGSAAPFLDSAVQVRHPHGSSRARGHGSLTD